MRIGKRTVLLLTVVAAMLLAFSGVVLAQQERERPTPLGSLYFRLTARTE